MDTFASMYPLRESPRSLGSNLEIKNGVILSQIRSQPRVDFFTEIIQTFVAGTADTIGIV